MSDKTITGIVTWLKNWFYDESEVDNLLNSKQNTLVSGTNIKTINNNSLLGSGNISISGGSTVDTSLDTSSTNPVQNQAIATEINSLNTSITNLEYDTGWQTLTINNNKFTHYDNDAQLLQIRKVGRIVELTGSLKNTSSITLNATEVNVATIPTEYRPTKHIFGLMQGSGTNVFEVTVNKVNGALNVSRYRSNTTTYPSVASGSWFPIHLTWIV